jgi:SPP1 gp7 family putative phage head morphogenesis protein
MADVKNEAVDETEKTKGEKMPDMAAGNKTNLMAEVYTGTAEETFYKSPMVPQSYQQPYNSDDLYKKTGDYTIYEEMGMDDQVSVCLSLKKELVMGSGFSIVLDEDGSDEIKDDLEAALNEDVEEPFLEQVEEILTGYDFGFSLSEKIFKVNEDGKLRLKCLKTRHPNSWLIHQKDNGDVERFQQNTAQGYKDINPKSLIHFVHNKKFQNPYGTYDLRAAYAAWFAKRQVVRFYAMYMEYAAGPKPVGRYEKSAPDGFADRLLAILKNFQAKTAITIPKEVEVEFLEAKSNGEAYAKAINIFNMFIGRALFVPDLLGISGSETSGGSFSLGKEQISMFFMHIVKRRKTIENLINKHIIKPLVVYNFGFQEKYPKFQFNPLDDVNATEMAKAWLEAMGKKLWKANDDEINHFRKLVKFPEGDIEREEPQAIGPDGLPLPPGQAPEGGKLPPFGKKAGASVNEKPEGKKPSAEEPEESKKKDFAYKMDEGEYYKKVNFAAIKTKLDDYDQSILDETQRVTNKIFADLYDQISRKKLTTHQERTETLKLKYKKELKQALKNSFMLLYKDAQGQASAELLKSDFAAPVLGDQFLALIEQETFDFVGDWEYKILQSVRVNLAAAIKDGKPLSEIIGLLDSDGKKLSKESIARYARTKHTEVLNKGRLEFFKDSGVVVAYQYSAILDDRTSDICSSLHGKVFKAGSEPVPPLHFNCRSVLIPITKYEEFEADTKVGSKNISDFIEENKGKGFATR